MGPDTLIPEATRQSAQFPPAAAVSGRRLPIGAEPRPEGGVHFRLWAPHCREIAVEIEGLAPVPLAAGPDGYFSGAAREARTGMRYRFRIDRGDDALPDPASRFQPDGRILVTSGTQEIGAVTTPC